jgi:predicted SprT family Zn-dependent metalloprotease
VTLWYCPTAVPSARQATIYAFALNRARQAGLKLPAFEVHWRRRLGPHIANGTAWFNHNGIARVAFAADLPDDVLGRTVLHELQHLHDYAFESHLTTRECERRAIDFTNRQAFEVAGSRR